MTSSDKIVIYVAEAQIYLANLTFVTKTPVKLYW